MIATKERAEEKEHAVDIACEYGINLELCRSAEAWTHAWIKMLRDTDNTGSDDPTTLTVTRDMALEELDSLIPRDREGNATFRAQYAAHEILYRVDQKHGDLYRSLFQQPGIVPVPHFDALDSIVTQLIEERAANRFPYHLDSAQLPQDDRNMPESLERGGVEHAMFLFNSCYYMRGGIKSTAAFRSLSQIHAKHPELFNAERASKTEPTFIQAVLMDHGLNYKSKEVSASWVKNSQHLVDDYDGDPRNIFAGNINYDELVSRVSNEHGRGFIGFRKKMTSMLSYYLMSADLIEYRDYPLPVDFHVLRVSAATDIVTFDDTPEDGDIYAEQVLDMLRNMYRDYSVTNGISQLDVCDAVWSLSSAICGVQPGNVWLEPKRAEGRKGRSTEIHPLEINVDDPRQQRMYEKSCSLCPLEKSCHLNFPSKVYYVRGKMVGSERIRFPITTLF